MPWHSPCDLIRARLLTSRERRFNSEIVEFFSGPELCGEPAWLFPATGPGLGRLLGIPELRNYFGIRTPCTTAVLVADEHILAKLSQSLLEPGFRGRYLVRQDPADSLVKGPKLARGHRFEIMRFHFTNSCNICTEARIYCRSSLKQFLLTTMLPVVLTINTIAGNLHLTPATTVIIIFGSPDPEKDLRVLADPTRSHFNRTSAVTLALHRVRSSRLRS
jgi:hypothetical protein